MKLQPSDLGLMHQLCLATGFPPTNLHQYFSGALPALLDSFPELGTLRDLVFSLKMLMAPTLDVIPSPKPEQWSQLQTHLAWSYAPESDTMLVSAFGEGTLRCAGHVTDFAQISPDLPASRLISLPPPICPGT